jgi:DNA uptake protein ComE-like DNA-binding protein
MSDRVTRPSCDLNSAPVEEIARLDGVDLAQAHALALWRPYLDWDEVADVPGFEPADIDRLKAAGAVLVLPGHATWKRAGPPPFG